jgi:hypothetical protein
MMRYAVAGVLSVLLLAGCSGHASQAGTPAAAPPAASAVARLLHAAGFTDCGPAQGGGVTDSGTAYLDGKRIGIDTFPGADVRDRWEKTARNFGVVPFRQDSQWVAYVAVDQNAKGCS